MDFFEALKANALSKTDEFEGVHATIEALREMMAGEPMKAEIQHTVSEGYAYTEVAFEEHDMAHMWFFGHHGTDGEEVAVFIVRTGRKEQDCL